MGNDVPTVVGERDGSDKPRRFRWSWGVGILVSVAGLAAHAHRVDLLAGVVAAGVLLHLLGAGALTLLGGVALAGTSRLRRRGRTMGWARAYEPLVALLALGRAGAMRRRTVDLAGIGAGERVLDVGCGTGALTRLIRERVGPTGFVAAIDPSPEMVAVARRKMTVAGLAIEVRVAGVEALPFVDGGFDAVVASLMAHHLTDGERQRGLAEVRRVLRPGGRLLLVDLARPAEARGWLAPALLLHGGRTEVFDALPSLLRGAGFEGIEVGAVGVGPLGFVRCRRGLGMD